MGSKNEIKIERIEYPFEIKEITEDENFFHIFGLANTWDIDLGDDRSIKGCFLESIKELELKAPPVFGDSGFKALMPALWQHRSDKPIGVHVELKETEMGLWSHSIYPKDDTFVTGKLIPQVRVGSIRKLSIGYRAEKVAFDEINGRSVRDLIKVRLREASPVTFPMNENATISDIKTDCQNIDTEKAEKLTEREFENLLTDGNVKFSKNASKAIISLIKSGWDAEGDEQRDAEKDLVIVGKMDELINLMEKK